MPNYDKLYPLYMRRQEDYKYYKKDVGKVTNRDPSPEEKDEYLRVKSQSKISKTKNNVSQVYFGDDLSS